MALAFALVLGAGSTRADAPPAEQPAPAAAAQFNFPAGHAPAWLYRQALEQADPAARHDLAGRLESGLAGPADPAAAARLYRLAAEQGHAPSQYALGRMLRARTGTERNEAEAARRFKQAAERGHLAAREALTAMRVPLQPPAAPLPPVAGKAPNWPQIFAAPTRPVTEADCLAIRGYSLVSAGQAVILCRRAVGGDAASLYRLGLLHLDGAAVPRDDSFGVRMLRLAANLGHAPARETLAALQAGARTPARARAQAGQADGVDPGPEPAR